MLSFQISHVALLFHPFPPFPFREVHFMCLLKRKSLSSVEFLGWGPRRQCSSVLGMELLSLSWWFSSSLVHCAECSHIPLSQEDLPISKVIITHSNPESHFLRTPSNSCPEVKKNSCWWSHSWWSHSLLQTSLHQKAIYCICPTHPRGQHESTSTRRYSA